VDRLDALDGRHAALWSRIAEPDGIQEYTEVVGTLAVGPDAVSVTTPGGPERVPRPDVVAVRPLPEGGEWSAVERLDDLCADAWGALVESAAGRWRLRSARGWSRSTDSALAVGDPGSTVAGSLRAVRAFADLHRIPPRVQVATGSPVDREVTAHGWVPDTGHRRGPEVAVLVAPVVALAEDCHPGTWVEDRPDDGWWYPGYPDGRPRRTVPRAARAVLDPVGSGLPLGFVTSLDLTDVPQWTQGRLRAAVVGDHLHLSWPAVTDARVWGRQGDLAEMIATAAHWSLERGAEWAVAQVAVGVDRSTFVNHFARAHFVEHHRYRYLVPPP
jgi:hypothetical protein